MRTLQAEELAERSANQERHDVTHVHQSQQSAPKMPSLLDLGNIIRLIRSYFISLRSFLQYTVNGHCEATLEDIATPSGATKDRETEKSGQE